MTDTVAPSAAIPVDGGQTMPRRLVAALAVTQTVGYGVLFYAFSVLLVPIAADLHTSTAAITGALTASIVVAAGMAIPVGRWLDRHGGHGAMTTGSVLGVVAVVGWSQVHELWQLYAVFVLIGVAGAASLYEAAFPVIIASTGSDTRDRALLAVTIVAGFASSIFFPLTGLLLEHFGWRSTLLVLAALLGLFNIPLHAILVPGRAAFRQRLSSSSAGSGVDDALRDARFWLITAAFVVQGAAISAVGVLLVTYLRSAGHPTTLAAGLSGLLGILSVTGRLATTVTARRYGMTAITAVVFLIQGLGVIALPHAGRTVGGAAACIIAFGLGFGVATIARPAIVADRYGTARYATIAAAMTLPITLAKAFAPVGGAAMPATAFLTVAGGCCIASAALLWFVRGRFVSRHNVISHSTGTRIESDYESYSHEQADKLSRDEAGH
jgi:predicted MFS family arabinose efflux permease